MERQLRKTKEKAIGKGKWQGRGGPKGAFRVSELVPADYDADIELPKDRKVRDVAPNFAPNPSEVAPKTWSGPAQTLERFRQRAAQGLCINRVGALGFTHKANERAAPV